MVDEIIRIIIDPSRARTGGNTARNELNRIESAAQRVGNAIRNALAFVGISVATDSLVRLSDTFTNIQNRLRLVTGSTAELNRVTAELFELSTRTRRQALKLLQLYLHEQLWHHRNWEYPVKNS